MSPRAEISLPLGYDRRELEEAATALGGHVVAITELPIVTVKEVSSYSLARFLADQNPDPHFNFILEPMHSPTYSSIFSRLRHYLPYAEQEKLLRTFYAEGVIDFPNGKELGEALAVVNNIPWFKPTENPDPNHLQQFCNEFRNRLNTSSLPIKIIENDWAAAEDAKKRAGTKTIWVARKAAAWAMAKDITVRGVIGGMVTNVACEAERWETKRYAAKDSAEEAARGATKEPTVFREWLTPSLTREWAEQTAAIDAIEYATWVVVSDLMPQRGYTQGNPLEPLMEIYKLGYWPIGSVKNSSGQEEFVVFVPPIQKST